MNQLNGRKLQLGLALGSGAARGWSHIGVIKQLHEMGLKPDIISGTSIGSLVGAFYAADKLDELEAWVKALSWKDVAGYLDLSMDGGLIAGKKLFSFLRQHFYDLDFKDLSLPFGAVATELVSGREVWLREGSVMDAARASSSVPGLFSPVYHGDEQWLIDGGLVNPTPVSLCRAMGADVVIAVDLNGYLMYKHESTELASEDEGEEDELSWGERLFQGKLWPDLLPIGRKEKDDTPSILEVLSRSINIMQQRVSRSRMAGDPPDVLITPRLPQINLMDFHRGSESIKEGMRATKRAANQIEDLKFS